jgi:hypothetical protein
MRTKAEIIEASVYFTELYDAHLAGVPLHEAFRQAAERFTDYNNCEIAMVMMLAGRIFDGRQAGCITTEYRVH